MGKKYLEALEEKRRLEAHQRKEYSKKKETYRVIYCKEAEEYTVQLKTDEDWLCLH